MRMAAGVRKLDALVEGGVWRDAVEMEKLEGAKAKRDGDRFGKALVRPLQKRLDSGVEGDLPAQRAEHEGGRQVAVFRGELCGMCGVEEVVAVALPRCDKHEDFKRRDTGGRDGL